MHDTSKYREARMMNAVAGLGGRSALSSEVDLRLGLAPSITGFPQWGAALAIWLGLAGRARSNAAAGTSGTAAKIGEMSKA